MSDMKNIVESFLKQQQSCLDKLSEQKDVLENIISKLIDARDNGKSIFTMGNGGSGSTSSHLVSDLLKTAITKNNKRFSAISLVDNIPVILAWANDVSYDDIFVEQIKNFLSEGDIVVAFSGSGKSKNVLKALKYAREKGAFCIGLTGMSGGEFPNNCDLCLIVPSNDMLAIESVHVTICHCIITAIRSIGVPEFRYG